MKTRSRQAREVELSSRPPAEQEENRGRRRRRRRRRTVREKTKKTKERGDKGRTARVEDSEWDRKGEEAEAVG